MKHYLRMSTMISAMLISVTMVILALSSAEAENPNKPTILPTLTQWAIMTNVSATVNIVDTGTNIVHGPFLEGQLGSVGGQLLDVAVTPNGQTALVSNFGDRAVYFIDISNPLSPSVLVSVTTEIFAEDIAISKDGKYAIVSDGTFSTQVETISIVNRTRVYTTSLGTKHAQAVDIAPDGTVILADYSGGRVHSMLLDSTGHLTFANTYTPTVDGNASRPLNIGIAPDGQTVIVCQAPYTNTATTALSAVGVFKITSPGVLSYTGTIYPLSRSAQSVAFSPAGDKAYISGNGAISSTESLSDTISILDITSPGIVSLNTENAADLFHTTSAQLFGVDTIAVANGKAFVGYPVTSVITGTNSLSVVDLTTLSTITSTMNARPVGVATIPLNKIYLPIIHKYVP